MPHGTENPRVGGSIPPPAIPLKTRRVQEICSKIIRCRIYTVRSPSPECDRLADRPRAGAPAPAAVRGLSKAPCLDRCRRSRFTAGGSLVRFDNGEPASRGGECPKRSEITEFSQKSRQRLRLSLAKVDQSKCGRPIFSGLTYPADFPLDQRTFKRHLKMFSQRFLRGFPKAGFHWKLEFQARGRGTFSSNLLEPPERWRISEGVPRLASA